MTLHIKSALLLTVSHSIHIEHKDVEVSATELSHTLRGNVYIFYYSFAVLHRKGEGKVTP